MKSVARILAQSGDGPRHLRDRRNCTDLAKVVSQFLRLVRAAVPDALQTGRPLARHSVCTVHGRW